MTEDGQEGPHRTVKVALVGVPGSGKSSILRNIADRVAGAGVRVGEMAGAKVFRTEFFWPEPLSDGSRMAVQLFALSGMPIYNAAFELLMAKCDGLVFVADAAGGRSDHARSALRTMVFNAERHGMNLSELPVAMQYHRTDLHPGFRAEQLDSELGVAPGSVPRFATSTYDGSDPGAAVAWVLTEIARRNGNHPTTNGA